MVTLIRKLVLLKLNVMAVMFMATTQVAWSGQYTKPFVPVDAAQNLINTIANLGPKLTMTRLEADVLYRGMTSNYGASSSQLPQEILRECTVERVNHCIVELRSSSRGTVIRYEWESSDTIKVTQIFGFSQMSFFVTAKVKGLTITYDPSQKTYLDNSLQAKDLRERSGITKDFEKLTALEMVRILIGHETDETDRNQLKAMVVEDFSGNQIQSKLIVSDAAKSKVLEYRMIFLTSAEPRPVKSVNF